MAGVFSYPLLSFCDLRIEQGYPTSGFQEYRNIWAEKSVTKAGLQIILFIDLKTVVCPVASGILAIFMACMMKSSVRIPGFKKQN